MFPHFLLQNSVETSLVVLVVEYFTLLLYHSVGMHELNRIKASIVENMGHMRLTAWPSTATFIAISVHFCVHGNHARVYSVT